MNGLAHDDRGNLDRFTGHSLRYSPSQRVHTVPGDYLAFNSIGFADLFIRNKEKWCETECSHSCSDKVKNVYSHKNSADDFLARRETTLLATKTKYIMGEDVLFHDMHYL